ncbi:HNH endonuclease [Rathayibacter sp. AY2B3]|uniref:HNH endonuclease signature motif containing protein n=1 Tax=Rathayibacter sp. AY2B3 TaxID=2080569 RepID=UPI000CE84B4A|nr:HNH endonuclease signature motif containing protein [Rathayibacter sp. AY2B3]PPG51692.1 HNH endonuclease [Rathayibacter sp. AY2B3]
MADAETVRGEVLALGDRAAALARSASPVLLSAAEALHAGHRTALTCPEAFARGSSARDEDATDLVDRSIRAEFAVALGISERTAARELLHASLLMEELPRTRAALAHARMRWEAGQLICSVAATLPAAARAAYDDRAVDLAETLTPGQLRHALARVREELHDEPLMERHARAREDRRVWLTAGIDGMATVCAHVPAPQAVGALARLDRIARDLRDGGQGERDLRTLAQLRADAWTDLLCHGDVAGTTPEGAAAPSTGPRAEVRVTVAASTAAGDDEAAAELDGYGPIPAEAVRALIDDDAAFTPVLTDEETGAVVSVGRRHRLPPPRMRLLVRLRDQTCRFPGCTRPASSTETDHSVEWRNGGETAPENLASLCVAHHHVRHGDRWTYLLHPDGTADWTTPTGRRVTTRPPALPGRPPEGAGRRPVVPRLDGDPAG